MLGHRTIHLREDGSMRTPALVAPASAVGIVIKSGAPAPKPVRFWAYMWAADEDACDDHWHQHVPTEHAA
jgi:hypothetical protein